jgi:hypothetical protein
MNITLKDILHEHTYKGNMISKNLPKELDNTLFSLIHMAGGFTSSDVVGFANNANHREISLLTKMVKDLDLYCDVKVKKFNRDDIRCSSRYKALTIFIKVICEDGGVNSLNEGISPTDEIYKRLVPEHIKKAIFKSWDRIGNPDWRILKAFDVDIDFDGPWTNSGDILYPLLEIEWLGGIDNTRVGKSSDKWREVDSGGGRLPTHLKYKAIPYDFDYLWDSSESFGEKGYSCWSIHFEITKDSMFLGTTMSNIFEVDGPMTNLSEYDDVGIEIIDRLWEATPAFTDQFSSFCQVKVTLV